MNIAVLKQYTYKFMWPSKKIGYKVNQTTHQSKYLTKLNKISLYPTDIPPDLLYSMDLVRYAQSKGNYFEKKINLTTGKKQFDSW